MALSKTVTLGNGLSITDAYIKIDKVLGTKTSMQLMVSVYTSQSASEQYQPAQTYFYDFSSDYTDSAKNIFKQGYQYLKTLSNFSSATNILETGQTA